MGLDGSPLDWEIDKMKPKPPPPRNKLILREFGQCCPKCRRSVLNTIYSTHKYDTNKVQEYLRCKCLSCEYTYNMLTAEDPENPKKGGK
jgi:hypothetical protein